VAEVARITRLYREQYAGFNAAHFHEFAQRDHGVTLGYTFVKRLLQTTGLLPRAARGVATAAAASRAPARRRRPEDCRPSTMSLPLTVIRVSIRGPCISAGLTGR
jgi:hypothetical protein